MYNLRYHLASLVAVFLALAVGLLLGSVAVQQGSVDKQRTALVTSLQSDFKDIRSTNSKLQAQQQRDTAFIAQATSALDVGSLSGRTVLVIVNSGRSDGRSAVEDAVRAAGGTLATLNLHKEGLGLDDATVAGAVAPIVGAVAGSAQLSERVRNVLTTELTKSGQRPLLTALSDGGVLSVDGLSEGTTIDACVVLAVWNDHPDAVILDIGSGIADTGIPVAGVESTTRDTGMASEARGAGLSAVDDVDVQLGAYSLTQVLGGRARGWFGEKSGAERAFAPFTLP